MRGQQIVSFLCGMNGWMDGWGLVWSGLACPVLVWGVSASVSVRVCVLYSILLRLPPVFRTYTNQPMYI